MTDEQVELLKVFHELFDDKPNARIVLYGLDINTAFLLPQIKEQTVIGLMDAENVGATFYKFLTKYSNQIAASMADNIFGELTRSGHLLLNERLKDIFIFEDNFRGGGKIALGV